MKLLAPGARCICNDLGIYVEKSAQLMMHIMELFRLLVVQGLNSVTGFMDDFTLNADGAAVVAASWGKSKIVQFGSFIALNLPQPSLGAVSFLHTM